MAYGRTAFVVAAVALAACCLGAWAAENPTSGPAVGEGTATFNVQDVTGLAKGGQICYI